MEVRFFSSDIEKFIEQQEKDTEAKIERAIERLEVFGHHLRMPYSKMIERNIFELRVQGTESIRLFYTFHSGLALIVHGCVKKSNAIPKKELSLVRTRVHILAAI